MSSRHGLQYRITVSMLMLVVISNSLFAVAIYFFNDKFEETLLNNQITNEANAFIAKLSLNPDIELPQSLNYYIYLDSRKQQNPIPEAFVSKALGTYHEVNSNDRSYHLTIRKIESDTLYLAYDITDLETQERKLQWLLISGAVLTPLLALWLGLWLSRKVISPLRALTDEVANIDPEQRNIRLSDQYKGYEVSRIAAAFNRYLSRMDDFVAREQSFSAAASHELRTPLSIISTSCELLAQDTHLSASAQSALNKITRASQQMLELVTAFLFLARGKTEAHDKDTLTELCPLLQQVLDNHQHLIAHKPISLNLQCDQSTQIPAPASHISIVVSNILRNACYHTQTGRIDISLKDKQVIIKDTGSGIAPEDIDNLFSRQDYKPLSQGYGLGLHIAKNICDRYDWQLHIQSTLNKGTTVTINLSV